MPYRRGGFSGRRGFSLRPVNSMKNVVTDTEAYTTSLVITQIAKAVDTPTTAVDIEVQRGSTIKAIWLSLDFCGLAGSGALQTTSVYLMKNPGANLTAPGAFSIGSSNEKKFVIKQWHQMTMRNQDGNPPYHWEGWIKIPKRFQRMGTDDLWVIGGQVSTITGHMTVQVIYKWYS